MKSVCLERIGFVKKNILFELQQTYWIFCNKIVLQQERQREAWRDKI